ncbi:MAG: hypothetical protein K2J60_13010 [Acetatifactor sp.]|nr:hypothetical protein [Acetatifactor sp.]
MNKRKNKLAALGGVVCVALSVLLSPASALPVQAAVSQDPVVMPMKDAISWEYKIENNKLYKRLYNHSTGSWIGKWIYVCDL